MAFELGRLKGWALWRVILNLGSMATEAPRIKFQTN